MTDKIIKKLYNKIDLLDGSKIMYNRFYVSKANRLIRKLKIHLATNET